MLALLPRLRRFAYGLTGSVHDGDDLVQTTCERAIRNLDSWQAGTRLDSWMFRIARNQYLNQIRAAKARGPHLEVEGTDEVTGEEVEGQLDTGYVDVDAMFEELLQDASDFAGAVAA